MISNLEKIFNISDKSMIFGGNFDVTPIIPHYTSLVEQRAILSWQ